jgi:hypothetical protein
MIAECDAFSTLQFLLQQSPWAGGLGWDTLEEQLREAFNLLPIDEGPLAEVLIETIEETHQDKTTDGVFPNQRRYDWTIFICHARLGKPVALPNGVRLVCDCCLVPQSVMNEHEPERELFCAVCAMGTTIVCADIYCALPNPKALDYVIGL